MVRTINLRIDDTMFNLLKKEKEKEEKANGMKLSWEDFVTGLLHLK